MSREPRLNGPDWNENDHGAGSMANADYMLHPWLQESTL
jgi:hypothetical protein